MSRYAAHIDLDNPNMNHTQVVRLVGEGKRVLDIGCWTGDLGEVLRDQGNTVTGVEYITDAAAEAEKRLDRVVVADLNITTDLASVVGEERYDVVVFSEVLEHLLHPEKVLRSAAAVLTEGGRVVVSVPNVTHGALRLALLQGAWDMNDTGLLDRTHINFYSRAGLLRLMAAAGYVVQELTGTLNDPIRTEIPVDLDHLPPHVVEWVRDQQDSYVYQFQLSARPRVGADVPGECPDLVPAVPLSAVRANDELTEARVRSQRGELVMRDHVLGLQAQATTAQLKAERAADRAASLRTRVVRLRVRLRRHERYIRQLEGKVQEQERSLAAASAGWAGIARSAARHLRNR